MGKFCQIIMHSYCPLFMLKNGFGALSRALLFLEKGCIEPNFKLET